MSRGIPKSKPASPTLRLMVTEGVSADPTQPLYPGTEIEYKEITKVNQGDLVDFEIDPATGLAVKLNTVAAGTVITSDSDENIVVGSGESVMISGAHVEGKITVNGGYLCIVNGATVSGKIQSNMADSYILAEGSTIEGKIESNSGGNLSLVKCSIFGKVTSNGNKFVGVIGCTVNGKVEVTNAGKYINQ